MAPVAGEHVAELMAQFAVEEDHGLRCWLLELIGMAKAPEAMELLASQLHGDDESLRSWAARGLQLLDTKQSRRLLWEWSQGSPEQHSQFGRWSHPTPEPGAENHP